MQINHTVVCCSDQSQSSSFLVEIRGRPAATRFGPFHVVSLDNNVSLGYLQTNKAIEPQHYAFLITESEFEAVLGRITDRGTTYWADPGRKRAGEINRNDGGRGVYFNDPDGHLLEVITVTYGGKKAMFEGAPAHSNNDHSVLRRTNVLAVWLGARPD